MSTNPGGSPAALNRLAGAAADFDKVLLTARVQVPFVRSSPPRYAALVPRYSREPVDRTAHRRRFDRFYTRIGGAYDLFVKVVPLWRRWLRRALRLPDLGD